MKTLRTILFLCVFYALAVMVLAVALMSATVASITGTLGEFLFSPFGMGMGSVYSLPVFIMVEIFLITRICKTSFSDSFFPVVGANLFSLALVVLLAGFLGFNIGYTYGWPVPGRLLPWLVMSAACLVSTVVEWPIYRKFIIHAGAAESLKITFLVNVIGYIVVAVYLRWFERLLSVL